MNHGKSKILQLFNKYGIENYSYLEEANNYGINAVTDNIKINPANFHPSVELCQSYAKVLLSILKDKHKDFLGEPSGVYKPSININDWMPYSLIPERVDEMTYNITYPKKGEELSFLNLPVNNDYVKLNFEDPIKLDEISIEGQNIKEITLWVNVINNELGYDDQVMIELGTQNNIFSWSIPNDMQVTSINISAKIKSGKSEKLAIKLKQ